MDSTTQRQTASKGGRTAQAKGVAYKWTSEQARLAGRKGGMAAHQPVTYRCLDCGSLHVAKEHPPKIPKATPEHVVLISSTLSCATPRSVYWQPLTGWILDAARGVPMFVCDSEDDAISMCNQHGFIYAGVVTRKQRKRG